MKPTATIRIVTFAAIIAFTGCATVRTRTPEGRAVKMNEAEFAAYVERVFRHHNAVVNELMFVSTISDDGNSHADAELREAESKMDLACLPLNELISALSGGQTPSLKSKMRLATAVPECESATRDVELLIPSPALDSLHPTSEIQ